MCAVVVAGCSKSIDIKEPPATHDDELAAQVNEAVRAAESIYADTRFWDLVEKRTWVGMDDAKTATDGCAVRAALQGLRPTKQHYGARHIGFWAHIPIVNWWKKGSFGITSACEDRKPEAGTCGRIYVSLDHFPEDELDFRVNTVTHEMTHTIGRGTGPCGCGDIRSRFTDTGGDSSDGLRVWLVSYGIGDLAQCFRTSDGDETKTWDCFDHLMDGQDCNRPIVECCPNAADTPAIEEARQRSPRCLGIKAICPAPSEVKCKYGR